MIQVSKITKDFGRLKVLKGIDLNCERGECIALIGPNGCGKTTLIKSILGMVIPSSGQILFDGKSIRNDFSYRRKIGYMPQIGRYPDNMKVGQVIEMIRNIRETPASMDEELMSTFKLKDFLDKKMRTLSGGTTQKVSAVLAFLFDPDVLILDEPTAGLDPLAAEALKEKIIRERDKGKLVLITSHLLSELDDMVSQVVFMQEGQLKFHKTIHELREMTNETRISKVIANLLRKQKDEQDS